MHNCLSVLEKETEAAERKEEESFCFISFPSSCSPALLLSSSSSSSTSSYPLSLSIAQLKCTDIVLFCSPPGAQFSPHFNYSELLIK